MAVTFLAAIVTVTLSSSLDLVFDEQKLAFIQDIASDDPITGDDTVSPRTKVTRCG